MTFERDIISEAKSTRLSVFNWAATAIIIPITPKLILKTHCILLFYSPPLLSPPLPSSSPHPDTADCNRSCINSIKV